MSYRSLCCAFELNRLPPFCGMITKTYGIMSNLKMSNPECVKLCYCFRKLEKKDYSSNLLKSSIINAKTFILLKLFLQAKLFCEHQLDVIFSKCLLCKTFCSFVFYGVTHVQEVRCLMDILLKASKQSWCSFTVYK